jgi:antitoxin component YwqK of YwqJK toxin-antitoxin module
MKLQLILKLIIVFSVSTSSAQALKFDPNKIKAEYFQDKEVKHKLEFNDKKGNSYKIYNTKYSKGLYIKKNEKWQKHGVHYTYSSGKISSKTTYLYGKKEGKYESYQSNGKVKYKCDYVKDKKDGLWQHFRDDSSIFEEIPYSKGLKEGTRIEYHRNGVKNFVTQYSNGVRDGDNLQYNNKGKLVAKTKYSRGKKLGKTIWY